LPRHDGKDNLVPPVRTTEEARQRGANGGKASGEARRKKALMSTMFGEWLADEHGIKLDGKERKLTGVELLKLVNTKIMLKADSTSVQLQRVMFDATEGSKSRVDLSGHMDMTHLSLDKLSPEEFQAAQDAFVIRNGERIERLKKEAEERLMLEAPEEREE